MPRFSEGDALGYTSSLRLCVSAFRILLALNAETQSVPCPSLSACVLYTDWHHTDKPRGMGVAVFPWRGMDESSDREARLKPVAKAGAG